VETAVRERARVVVVNSPNNPTGSALPEGAVERLLAETGALVVCDEAYQDFGGPTAIPLLRRSSRLVVLRTFSKAMGLAGLRFGLALAHPEVAREIAKGKLPYNVNLVTLAAAEVALDHGDTLAARTGAIAATRDRFLPRLAALPGIEVFPTAANFVLVRCLARPAGEVFRRCRRPGGVPADLDRHRGGHGGGAGGAAPDPGGGAMSARVGEVRRTTKETDLYVRVDLDGRGEARVKTGIGFFDHMLEALARHGLLDLTVEAHGDLHVDGHHTVEDTGIARGLGDRAGIRRYGDALVPLDDALVRAVVDVSGRPYVHYDIEIPKWQMLGDYDVFLTPEFFRAVVLNAGLTAHLDLVRGENPHHIVEAAFKAFARALDAATSLDPRVTGVPSTKGTL
jgi:imidazoleglycerol-phosphate dehydratase